MIVAAGLLVLAGLGLFVGGLLTGVTLLYWACVAVCVVAAVLLIAARRQMPPASPAAAPPTASVAGAARATAPAARLPAASADPAPAAHAHPTAPEDGQPPAGVTTGSHTGRRADAAAGEPGEPPVEDVEMTDLLLVVDLQDEVLVVDEHPRYHLGGCSHIAGRPTIPLPLGEARTDGFTPCGICRPDGTLADRVRARKAAPDS